jgi:hypothetical protein
VTALLEERLLREFAHRLNDEAAAAHEDLDEGFRLSWEVALTQVAMGYMSDTGAPESDAFCPHEDTDGRDRCKVVAYSIDEDERHLLLVTAVHRAFGPQDDVPFLARDEVTKATGWAARFFRHAARREFARFAGNDHALAAAKEIRRKLDRIDGVTVAFVTNALVRDREVADQDELGKPIQFEVWDLERLQRAGADAVTRDHIEVDFEKVMGSPLPVLEMKPPATEYQTFLAVVPGDVLYRLYEEYGARLFEFNVRSFLQATGKVNKGIRATLLDQTERERFLAYNNGITATADAIDVGLDGGQTVIRSLRGLQIVNGAQTTASIHRARKHDKVDVARVAVAMKLTCVRPEKLGEFVPLISRYANTQNPVQVADLTANSTFHVRLEQLAEKVWCPGEGERWFYERARGAYQVARNRFGSTKAKRAEFDAECPKAKRFGKTELAKAWMAWWGLPHVVGRGSQKNYTAFMGQVEVRKGVGWEPDEAFLRDTAALLLLMQAAQRACRTAALGSYGANVVALMLARLAHDHAETLDLERLWDRQAVSDALKAVMVDWARAIHAALRASAGSENVTEHAKKEASWEAIRRLDLPWPAEGVPETADEPEAEPRAPGNADGAEDAEPDGDGDPAADKIADCMELDGPAWGQVMAWAAGSQLVTPYDRRVAGSVFQLAMDGWVKPPSPKQAKRAARVLAAARRAGVLGKRAA